MVTILNEDARLSSLTLYVEKLEVSVQQSTQPPNWEEIIELAEITQKESIFALRRLYRELGKDPSRYRSSVEALMRRVAQNKDFYAINTVVDAGNLLSLSLECPIGIYDADEIKGQVKLSVGQDEIYETIGKGTYNIHSLPTLYDDLGPFGNPNSDSKRTRVSETTKQILLVIYICDNIVSQEQIAVEVERFKRAISVDK